jgi:outer membrane protein
MKKIVLALVVMFSIGSVMAQQKIGHVNSQKLLDTLPSRKAAIEQLRLFEENGIQELQEMEADFNKQIAVYEKNRPTMSPVIIKIEEEKLMKKQQALQEREQSLNAEMQAVSQELNKPILERVQKAVEIVSDRKKLSYVIDESTTLYFKGGMDITAEVILELLRLDAEATAK